MKKIVSFMMVVVLFVLTSCKTATTPQQSYAAGMQPALEQIETWQGEFSDLDVLLTEELDPTTGVNRLQLIELYNMAMEYQINRDEYTRLGLTPLDGLVGASVDVAKHGKAILEIVSSVTPVEELQFDHQVILDCVQTRVAFADELSSSIKDLSAIDMNKAGELIACD